RPLRLSVLLLLLRPVAISLQPPLQHELGLALLGRDRTNDVFTQPGRQPVFVYRGHKAPLVLLLGKVVNLIDCAAHLAPSATLSAGLMDATISCSCLRSCFAIS